MPPTLPQTWPRSWARSAEAERLWARLCAAQRSVLLLDYDGTLAPFTSDRLHAHPYPGMKERLAALAGSPRVRLVLVSGRPARELDVLLGSPNSGAPDPGPGQAGFEIWGSHGLEHLQSDGSYHLRPLPAAERAAMDQVRRQIEGLGYAQTVERKPASLAVHWRGFEPAVQERIRSAMESLCEGQAGESGLELRAFDGGLELRPKNCTKGAAVERILAEEGARFPAACLPVAYLGDDLTDEDAFAALGDRGLSILVRAEARKTVANFWIKPPEELREFLDGWIRASVRENCQ